MTTATALTIEQVAELYGVDARVVRAWIASGDLRAVDVTLKRGSHKPRLRILPEALESFNAIRSTVPDIKPKRRATLPTVESFV